VQPDLQEHVFNFVQQHDPADPMFLFWAPHTVHAPLEVPPSFFQKFSMIAPTDRHGSSRQLYHAMVNFADAAVGNVTALLKEKGMWDDLVIVWIPPASQWHLNPTIWTRHFTLTHARMH
jgi:arylsulfatase B